MGAGPASTLEADTLFLSLPVPAHAHHSPLEVELAMRDMDLALLQDGAGVRHDGAEGRREGLGVEARVAVSRERSEDLALMQSRLGTSDLGSGTAGGALVATLLGAGSLIKHNDDSVSTKYSGAKRALWRARHQVLVEEALSASGRPIPDFHSVGFKLDTSKVQNGTFQFNGTAYNVTDFPRKDPPLRSLIPLLRFFDGEHKDSICNTDPYEFSDRQGAYKFQGVVAFVYSRRIVRDGEVQRDADMVPFYRYWNKARWPAAADHFFSLDPELKGDNLVRQGITGFLYKDAQPGLVALNEFFCAETGDHLYSVSLDKSMKLNGQTYNFQSVLGYVQPLDALAKLKAQRQAEREAKEEKNGKATDAVKEAPKQPESIAPKAKSTWHPGQPIFVGNQDWSK